MAKYSFEFKKRIVQEYLTGNCGYVYLAKKYDVPAISDIKNGLKIIKLLEMKDYCVLEKIKLIFSILNIMW